MPVPITCPMCRCRLDLPDGDYQAAVCPQCRASIALAIPSVQPAEEPLSLDDDPPAKPARAKPVSPPRSDNPFDFTPRPARDRSHRPAGRPDPDDCPKWLLGVAALPLALVAFGGLLGGLVGGVLMAINSVIARVRGMAVGFKLVAILGITFVGVAGFLVVREVLVAALRDTADETVESRPEPKRKDPPDPRRPQPRPPEEPPPRDNPPRNNPPEEQPDPVQPNPQIPPAGWDVPVTDFPASPAIPPGKRTDGVSTDEFYAQVNERYARLPDGPAAATAAHQYGDTLVVGYTDGSTAIWDMRKRITDPPAPGPQFPGPIDHIWIAGRGRYLVAQTAGRLRVATARPPHRGVLVPEGPCGMRLCAFGTAGIVRRTPEGYECRWLVHAVFDQTTLMPPQEFGKPFNGYERKLDPPPVEPQFLTWLHTTPAAVLPDGRITVWNPHGKALTVEAHPKPVRAWSISTNQVAMTTLDEAGNLQIRRHPDFTIDHQHRAEGLALTGVVSDPGGTWTLGADDRGGMTAWEYRDGKGRVIYQGVRGMPKEPAVPLTVTGFGAFVIGRGRAVELWAYHQLQKEPGGKK